MSTDPDDFEEMAARHEAYMQEREAELAELRSELAEARADCEYLISAIVEPCPLSLVERAHVERIARKFQPKDPNT